MKKTIVAVTLVLAAIGVLGVGVVSAQDGTPPFGGRGGMHDGTGPLHTFMAVEFARELGLNINDVNTRLANGETMYDIALSAGVTAEEFPALMSEIRSNALDAAVKANVITQEQADWMKSRGFGRGGMGGVGCSGTGPQGGRGQGMMGRGYGWQTPQQ